MAEIPPWLAINPRDFVAAAEAGARAGIAVGQVQQEAFQSSLNRSQRAAELQAQRELAQWEHELSANLKMQELAQEREKSKAEMSARLAYNLANLGIRERGLTSREEAAKQNLGWRQMQQERLQRTADIAERSLEQRIIAAQNKLPQQQAMALNDLYVQRRALKKAITDPLTDPARIPDLETQVQGLTNDIEKMIPAPGVPAPAAAPAATAIPSPFGAPGAQFTPGMTFQATLPGSEGLFGGAPATAAAPLSAVEPLPPSSTPDESGWIVKGPYRYRLKSAGAVTNQPPEVPPWPANEEGEGP